MREKEESGMILEWAVETGWAVGAFRWEREGGESCRWRWEERRGEVMSSNVATGS